MEETCSKWPEWQKVYVKIKISIKPGLYTNRQKICIKSDFKDIFWNLQSMDKVTRPFCWHQNFVHIGLSAPAPGLYTCGKTFKKKYINSEFKEICLKRATNGRSDKGFLLTSNVCPQGVFCPCPGAIYMYKIIKTVYKIKIPKRSFWNLQHMGKEKRPCHKIFVPNGLSAPAWGYIHVKKRT